MLCSMPPTHGHLRQFAASKGLTASFTQEQSLASLGLNYTKETHIAPLVNQELPTGSKNAIAIAAFFSNKGSGTVLTSQPL